jgi:hypothetical protein
MGIVFDFGVADQKLQTYSKWEIALLPTIQRRRKTTNACHHAEGPGEISNEWLGRP